MTFDAIKKAYIDGLLETEAFLVRPATEEPFTLRSGKKSYMFLDHARVAGFATAYKAFIDGIVYLLKREYGSSDYVLCNVDSKISAQMVGSVAYKLNKSQIIYKSKELVAVEKGTNQELTGNVNWKLPVAITDDVMTGGDGTAKKVGDLVQSVFPKIKNIQIFVGFIREPKQSTYKTHYIVTRDELLDIIWSKLSSDQRKAVDRERKGL